MIGTTISHYKIIDKLGEGGMGVVYLAEDTDLDRKVALKFLPLAVSSDTEARERLVREAKAASRLNHPNILTIHAVEQADDRHFIVMEYIEGQPLDEFIKIGDHPLDGLLKLAIQIAEGLEEAHSAGIVHRDLKPANILVDAKGRARILDFGLAKIEGTAKLTRTDSTLGTVAYMSPEQAQGLEVDHRSDLFSLGVVLYEMIAGQRPFRGEHEAAIIYSIVNEEHEPLGRFKASVSDELQRIVSKCLNKMPEERFQSAADLVADLRTLSRSKVTSAITTGRAARTPTRLRWIPVAAALGIAVMVVVIVLVWKPFVRDSEEPLSGRKMLAVLPFKNLGAPEDEYFADGITEEITMRLAKLSGLGIISRTSAVHYKNSEKSLQQIGKELGVQYVLEGTIRYARSDQSERARINPQLIRVTDDTHIWTESYDRVLDDIFEVQSAIAQKVAEALNVTLLEKEVLALEARPTENLAAYHAYMRGLDYLEGTGYVEKDFRLALDMLERAVALDSGFALAYAALSKVNSDLYHNGYERTREGSSRAKAAADRALELKPDLPEAHLAMGYYHYWCHRDYDRALQEFAVAEKDLHSDTRILEAVAYILRRQGKFEEALLRLARALESNLREGQLYLEYAYTNMSLRRYAEADRYFELSISVAPDQARAYLDKFRNYILWRGDIQKSRATMESMPEQSDQVTLLSWFQQEMYERDFQAVLNRLTASSAESHENQWAVHPKALLTAHAYLHMENQDSARAYFDTARIFLETRLQGSSDDHRLHSARGIALAGLGQTEEAVLEGKRGVELFPVSKDAIIGPARIQDLALIYTMTGQHAEAIDRLKYLLSIPSRYSVQWLRIDPRWDPLRDHPRFQALLEKGDRVF